MSCADGSFDVALDKGESLIQFTSACVKTAPTADDGSGRAHRDHGCAVVRGHRGVLRHRRRGANPPPPHLKLPFQTNSLETGINLTGHPGPQLGNELVVASHHTGLSSLTDHPLLALDSR